MERIKVLFNYKFRVFNLQHKMTESGQNEQNTILSRMVFPSVFSTLEKNRQPWIGIRRMMFQNRKLVFLKCNFLVSLTQ